MSISSSELGERTIRREAEFVRWVFSGKEGELDESRWMTVYDPVEDWLFLRYKPGPQFLRIPGHALSLSLGAVSEQFIRPFVSQLPSVLASARVKGDAEYASWGPA